MAAYIKTLKDAAGADIIYPQTKASAVFTEEGETVESALQEKVDIQMSRVLSQLIKKQAIFGIKFFKEVR